jgi:hypothetical protein
MQAAKRTVSLKFQHKVYSVLRELVHDYESTCKQSDSSVDIRETNK